MKKASCLAGYDIDFVKAIFNLSSSKKLLTSKNKFKLHRFIFDSNKFKNFKTEISKFLDN